MRSDFVHSDGPSGPYCAHSETPLDEAGSLLSSVFLRFLQTATHQHSNFSFGHFIVALYKVRRLLRIFVLELYSTKERHSVFAFLLYVICATYCTLLKKAFFFLYCICGYGHTTFLLYCQVRNAIMRIFRLEMENRHCFLLCNA